MYCNAFFISSSNRDPKWGIRDIDDLEQLAKENGLKLEKMVIVHYLQVY